LYLDINESFLVLKQQKGKRLPLGKFEMTRKAELEIKFP
jgi:hypothetical protein